MLTVNGLTPQTFTNFAPSVSSDYSITPSNSKITISNDGNLMIAVLDSSDSGTYTITSNDFGGASIVLQLAAEGK